MINRFFDVYYTTMKIIFLAISTFIFNYSNGQLTTNVSWTNETSMPKSEVTYYNKNVKLTWDDFKGTPNRGGIIAALTVSGFGYTANIKTTNGKGELNINVYCYFNLNKSWVKPEKNTAYILTHEQHHFDISYLAATIFIDKLRSAVFTTANFKSLIPIIYNESCDIMNKMQNDYDVQTKNGQIKEEQVRWNVLIDSKIASFTN